jgi:quercetin dioxygenase-like cupin family protein
MVAPNAAKWGDPPPGLPARARFAVISGDPTQPGPFAVRLQMPAGYQIAPHWHSTAEHVTVLSGTLSIGMGETVDAKAIQDLPAGGYVVIPAETRHYARARSAATIQIQGMGPFVISYVNAADDPSKQTR